MAIAESRMAIVAQCVGRGLGTSDEVAVKPGLVAEMLCMLIGDRDASA